MFEITYRDTKEIDQNVTGGAMRVAREAAGLTLQELAQALGCTRAYLSLLELGNGNLNEERVAKINAAIEELKHE